MTTVSTENKPEQTIAKGQLFVFAHELGQTIPVRPILSFNLNLNLDYENEPADIGGID